MSHWTHVSDSFYFMASSPPVVMLRTFQVLSCIILLTACTADEVLLSRVKRIIGGQNVRYGRWPWLVNLHGKFVTERILGIPIRYRHTFCGGSVLNDNWILTAAHCFDHVQGARDPSNWEARLATNSIRDSTLQFLRNILSVFTNREALRTWEIDIDRIVIHPQYNESNYWKNDIALVRLEETIPSGERFERIRRIQLPTAGNNTFPAVGDVCVMKGWGCRTRGTGVSRYAQEASLPIYPTRSCVTVRRATENHNRLCAGYRGYNVGICPGDSGGPLVCRNDDGEWVQVGVASFTSLRRPGDYPGVFTRVSSYVNWINSIIN